jgi:hypothetical protein
MGVFLLDLRRRFGSFFEATFAFVFFQGHGTILTVVYMQTAQKPD